jgi:hypothetical protein
MTVMKGRNGARLGFAASLLMALTACASHQPPPHPFEGGRGGGDHNPPGRESYAQALSIRQKQGCAAAVPILRRYAAQGGGFEIAQFELGDCLADEALATADEGERQTLTEEALANLLKAANSNEPNAQGVLADLYFRGRIVAQNKIEAAKWLLLYNRNNLRLNVGARPLPAGLEAEMRRTLSDGDWQMAQGLADNFNVVVQPVVAPPPADTAGPGDERDGPRPEGRRGGERQGGERRGGR